MPRCSHLLKSCARAHAVTAGHFLCGLVQYHSLIIAAVAVYNYSSHGFDLDSWPCWIPWGYCGCEGAITPPWCWRTWKVLTWSWNSLELAFLVWFWRELRQRSSPTPPPDFLSETERHRLFHRCLVQCGIWWRLCSYGAVGRDRGP